MTPRDVMQQALDDIEAKVATNKMTAAQVFTQMRQLFQAGLAKPAAVSRVEWSVIREFADRKKVNFYDLCAAVKESTEAYDRVQAELAAQQPAAPAVTPVDVEAVREVIAEMRECGVNGWPNKLARAIGDEK